MGCGKTGSKFVIWGPFATTHVKKQTRMYNANMAIDETSELSWL